MQDATISTGVGRGIGDAGHEMDAAARRPWAIVRYGAGGAGDAANYDAHPVLRLQGARRSKGTFAVVGTYGVAQSRRADNRAVAQAAKPRSRARLRGVAGRGGQLRRLGAALCRV